MIIIYSKTKWQIQLLIHIAKQTINRNKKYRVEQRSIIISALFDKTLKKQ